MGEQTVAILLGSGGFRTPERVAVWVDQMRSVLGPIRRVLFVPYALADHDGYLRMMTERGLNAGYPLEGIHQAADPVTAVAAAEGIFVGGGNTFRLLHALYRFALLDPIRVRVRAGAPYLGISAGTNVACPTIRTTNDMPIVQPPSLDALGLVPFQVNAHYYAGTNFVRHGDQLVEQFGETRDDRLREFHEENETPVVGLGEGGILRVESSRIELVGAAARLFRRGESPRDLDAGTDLAALL
jgi:dipeptidase E